MTRQLVVVAALFGCGANTPPPVTPAPKPVPPPAPVPCGPWMIDVAAFTTALAETTPLTVVDDTKREPEASASCGLVRGGARLTRAEQEAMIKKQGRLSVLPGDVVCEITAYCQTIPTEDAFRQACAQRHDRDDDSMGSYACLKVIPMGADDINVYRFLAHNGCVLQVRGGPANVDNAQISTCAKAARDTLGNAQIAPPR